MPTWPDADLAVPSASAADWLQLFALLDTALDLEPAKHPAWLAALSPENARLAPLLKALLQTHAAGAANDFMRLPAIFALPEPAPAVPPLDLQPSAQVGPYRLLREIGQGGMATVWLAERADGLLERQVALKLPHQSWGGATLADRMTGERKILALVEDGELEAAREPMQACLAFFSEGVDNPLQRANVQSIHARFLLTCGEYEQAISSYEKAHASRAQAHGPQHPLTVALSCRIGQVHLQRQHFRPAIAVFDSILAIEDDGEAVWDSVKQLVRMSLAMARLEQGDVAQALPALHQVFEHFHANAGRARYLMSEAEVSLNLGRALLQDGQAQGALPLLQGAVAVVQAMHPKSPALASHRGWLGLCCLALGDTPQAHVLADLARVALDAEPSVGAHYRRSLALLSEKLAA